MKIQHYRDYRIFPQDEENQEPGDTHVQPQHEDEAGEDTESKANLNQTRKRHRERENNKKDKDRLFLKIKKIIGSRQLLINYYLCLFWFLFTHGYVIMLRTFFCGDIYK